MPDATEKDPKPGYQFGYSACKTPGCRTLVKYEIGSSGGWSLDREQATCDVCGTTWKLKLYVNATDKASVSLEPA
jgi:hypothetical protein